MASLHKTNFYTAITQAAVAQRTIKDDPDWIAYQKAKKELKELGQGRWNEVELPRETAVLADLRARRLFLRERRYDTYEKREKIVDCCDEDFARKLSQFKDAYSKTVNLVVRAYRMWSKVLEYFVLQFYDKDFQLSTETTSRASKWYKKFACLGREELNAHRTYLSGCFERSREEIRLYGVEDLHCSEK